MKFLLDATFPSTLDGLANNEGITLHRMTEGLSDVALVEHAVSGGYAAIVVLDAEMVTSENLLVEARKYGISLVCSVTDDPLDAEVNLRRSLAVIRDFMIGNDAEVLWLRRDGIRVAGAHASTKGHP